MVKEKGVSMKVNIDFRDITLEGMLQTRIDNGLETRRKPITFCQATKIISNCIEANPKIKKKLCEAIINGN